MKMLVTAGNTITFIDKVRCITNVFSGRTGASIAVRAADRGHAVTLVTSRPQAVAEVLTDREPPAALPAIQTYQTFADLQASLRTQFNCMAYDAVLHCAAVSDYECAGVFAPTLETVFDPRTRTWSRPGGGAPTLASREAGKVKSTESELWLRLVQTPKLINQMRDPWGFRGVLVKFKLEVDITDEQLLVVAERSRCESAADLMVANTLAGMGDWALLGPLGTGYERVPRPDLAGRLVAEVERLVAAKSHQSR